MKNFIRIFYTCFIFSCLVFVGCSDPDEEEMRTLNAELNANVSEKADNANDANNAAVAKYYKANLSMLNESGVSGTAELKLEGNELTVNISATGLEPGELHPQHIHGFQEDNRNSTCPPASADNNGDGFISVGEGFPFYGGILLPLLNDVNDPLSFPTADADGEIKFEKTYTVNASITPLQNTSIVLHGKTVEGFINEEGETINGYRLTLPVACAQVTPNQGTIGNGR